MGTNYYYHMKPACECCGRPYEPLHIGKSSAGWCFSLHIIPEEGINTLDDWRKMWTIPGSYILDEYNREISVEQMEDAITNRAWVKPTTRSYDKYSEPGPNNLIRHRVDGRFCIGHGEGTWDYLIGEFS